MACGPLEIYDTIINDIRLLKGYLMCGPPAGQRATSGVRDRADSDAERDQGGSSWQEHGPSEPLHSLERRRSIDEGSHRSYDIPILTRAFEWPSPERDEPPPRFPANPDVEPPLTPSMDPPSGAASVRSYQEESESRFLRVPHYAESQYGRHRSAPLYGANDWERRASFGELPPPAPAGASSSRVVLPPVRHLLGEVGMLTPAVYGRGPVPPQLRLPEERAMGTGEEEESGRVRRGKKRDEGEEKRAVARKIYVACDFCRGRKLRCDGGRPRCSNCETRSLMCKYQEHPRRRGPGKAPKGTRTRKPRKRDGEDPEMAGPSVVP